MRWLRIFVMPGLSVSLIEMQDQVLAPIDFEMAQLLHENIVQNQVSLYLGDGVSSFADETTLCLLP